MNPLYKLSYGTFVLTIKHQEQKNACILNTVIQFSDEHLLMTVNKSSYSHSLLENQKYVAIHTLHKHASRKVFETFGYQSGKDLNKLEGFNYKETDEFIILEDNINSYFKGRIESRIDHETHTLYLIKILEGVSVNDIPSLTYAEYQSLVKPKKRSIADLEEAFLKESGARNRYTFYASIAKKEGYQNIADTFLSIADNEKEHAKLWLKQLDQLSNDTKENLKQAILHENIEWTEMYKQFEDDARNEGNENLANLFYMIRTIERDHSTQYQSILNQLENDNLYKDDKEVLWICNNCGYFYSGKEALMSCPVCNHEIGYMKRR